jgi:hypothetical protein
MPHDSDYFSRRAAEARAAAYSKDDGEGSALSGDLALAYAALARRRRLADSASSEAAPAEEPPVLVTE